MDQISLRELAAWVVAGGAGATLAISKIRTLNCSKKSQSEAVKKDAVSRESLESLSELLPKALPKIKTGVKDNAQIKALAKALKFEALPIKKSGEKARGVAKVQKRKGSKG